jgi:hypothetical protein
MKNAQRKVQNLVARTDSAFEMGWILESESLDAGQFRLADRDGNVFIVNKAFSCLIEPVVGDQVLWGFVDELSGRQAWVLAVLSRHSDDIAMMKFDRPVQLNSLDKISLISARGIESLTEGSLNFVGKALKVIATQAEGHTDEAVWSSRRMVSNFKQLSVVSETCTSVFQTLIQRMESYVRRVDGVEDVQAGSLHQAVDGTVTIYSKDTLLTSENQVKINAEVVHLS